MALRKRIFGPESIILEDKASAFLQQNLIWGLGNPARCTLDDLAFARLFHSLGPRGWTSDHGKALSQQLKGTWRNSQSVGLTQYKFMPNGRYEFGIGTITRMGLFERTTSSVADGRDELREAELTVTLTAATGASRNIASASPRSSSSGDGHARCRCSTRMRNRRSRYSICESRISPDRSILPGSI